MLLPAILISFTNQSLNVIITYLLYKYGRNSYFIASLIFVILTIIAESITFCLRFVPFTQIRKKSDLIIPIFQILIYMIIGIIIAPLTSFIIFIFEQYINQSNPSNWYQIQQRCNNNNKCFRYYGCIYVQYHESLINQWMQFKLIKHFGFIIQLIFDTIPHLMLQILCLIKD